MMEKNIKNNKYMYIIYVRTLYIYIYVICCTAEVGTPYFKLTLIKKFLEDQFWRRFGFEEIELLGGMMRKKPV